VRRGRFILAFWFVTLAAGVASLWLVPATDVELPGGSHTVHANCLLGAGLFCLAGVAAACGLAFLQNGCRRLAREMESATAKGVAPPAKLGPSHPNLLPIVNAYNEVCEQVGRWVARADLRAKELEIQLKVATAERQHAEAIIYSISDGVLVTDPFDEVVLANDSAARTFNFDLGRATRASIVDVLADPKMVALIREMRQSDSKGGRRILEHTVKTPEGDRTYKVTLSCVAGRGSRPAGVVAVLHDMTREREVAEMKNDFVSNVSHELRTPLASIKAYAEMLIDGEATDDKTRRDFYEVIHHEANRLGRLIDNILNISRIESGLVKMHRRPQSLLVILKEALEVILPQARQKRIELVEQISPAYYQVMIDRDMVYEAILNLLSNAVKYTPEGGRVTVETAVDEARKKVTTRIADTGVGIPAKDLPFVFDKFFRSDANNKMAKGTGLGLSLVKHIIEAVHKGRLFVESTVGKGSTFGFELDLVE
jgi:two-component system phosphate regulon sensor histidine kinase PhoR